MWPYRRRERVSKHQSFGNSITNEQELKPLCHRECEHSGCAQAAMKGLAKTHLQHLACATAMNIVRVLAWLEEPSVAPTRIFHFAALAM